MSCLSTFTTDSNSTFFQEMDLEIVKCEKEMQVKRPIEKKKEEVIGEKEGISTRRSTRKSGVPFHIKSFI